MVRPRDRFMGLAESKEMWDAETAHEVGKSGGEVMLMTGIFTIFDSSMLEGVAPKMISPSSLGPMGSLSEKRGASRSCCDWRADSIFDIPPVAAFHGGASPIAPS